MTIESAATFGREFDVSRETLDRLQMLVDLLQKWNARINLVARTDEVTLWHRHIADSAQLLPLRPLSSMRWLDLGAGAGFPGLVVAILTHERVPEVRVTLVESDGRKGAFLQTAILALGLPVQLHIGRSEELEPQNADVVSARGLAPLPRLLELASKHCAPGGICLFPKGAKVHKEIETALRLWRFEYRLHRSLTDEASAILEIEGIDHV